MTAFKKFFKKYISLGLLLFALLLPSGCDSFREEAAIPSSPSAESLEQIPAYQGEPYVEINNNQPDFTDEELEPDSYEFYSELDDLGRCGTAQACIGEDLMPTEDREAIGQIKPSGWHTVKYAGVDGNYLYNRCHLIGFQLTAENANPKNLITGTRSMNVDGMLPFENQVAEYIHKTDNHVLYRVTPIFEGDNLVACGVQMEAESVEDEGEGVSFNVYVYNVQKGVVIDYSNGSSEEGNPAGDPQTTPASGSAAAGDTDSEDSTSDSQTAKGDTYILNKNTQKFHLPDCSSVPDIKARNKENYTGTREELLERGYSPCGNCNP